MFQFLDFSRTWWHSLVVATGPLACAVAATTSYEIVDRVCVPLCYFSHVVVSSVMWWEGRGLQSPTLALDTDEDAQTHETTYYFGGGVESYRNESEHCSDNLERKQVDLEQPSNPFIRQDSTHSANTKRKSKQLPFVMFTRGLCILCLLWIISFMWALYGAIWGMDFKNKMAMMPRRWSFGPEVANLVPVPMAFPSPYFQPHALVCPRKGIFLADHYRVFELKDKGRGVEPFPCDVNGTIADLGASCNNDNCWPMVLLHGDPPTVLNCATGEQRTMLQTSAGLDRFTMSSDGVIYAASDAAKEVPIVQYQWQSHRDGWAPFWDVAKVNSGIRAIDVVDNRLLLFTSDGRVEAQNLDTGVNCGTWGLPPTLMGAGCGMPGSDSILVLVRNVMSEHRKAKGFNPVSLMEARLPGAEKTCGSTGIGVNTSWRLDSLGLSGMETV
jgi:hypothetical protein